MYRDHTKEVQIGNVTIGGGNPIRIQSMTNTKTDGKEKSPEPLGITGVQDFSFWF